MAELARRVKESGRELLAVAYRGCNLANHRHALAEFTAAGDSFVAGASQQFGTNGAHGLSKPFLRLEKL